MAIPTYDDDYSSCSETYSSLTIYHDDSPPTDVTGMLNIEPTKEIFKGKKIVGVKRPATVNGWFLSSRHKVDSCDTRRHIDWLVDQVYNKKEVIHDMIARGYTIDIFSFWVSKSANGGPTLSPYQMKRLSALNIEVSWDIYFGGDDEE